MSEELYLEGGGGIDFIHLKCDETRTMLEVGYGCVIIFSASGTIHEIVKQLAEALWQEDK